MNRVFKSDAEIDLNRCANALETIAELIETKVELKKDAQLRSLINEKAKELLTSPKTRRYIKDKLGLVEKESSPERGLATKPKRKPQAKEVKK